MSNTLRVSRAAVARLGWIALLLACRIPAGMAADSAAQTVTIMTRNVDAGTDLGYLFAGNDEASFVQGMAATWAELQASNFKGRAARLADEIDSVRPDLIALQEVTLWRTGPMFQPPAMDVAYDQLDLLLAELAKRKLHYGVVAVQIEIDAEAPVPTEGLDLRMTDRDVILARLDAPQSTLDVTSVQTHRFRAVFNFGNPLLGQIAVPCGWMAADVVVNGATFRFVNTHLQGTIPGVLQAEQVQRDQADELLSALLPNKIPIVLAGDFNANADPGPDYTGTVQQVLKAGFADTWRVAHHSDPGFTWPLFGEDQNSGTTTPNERIDLVFLRGAPQYGFDRTPTVVSADRTGIAVPYASDHAGLVVKLNVQ